MRSPTVSSRRCSALWLCAVGAGLWVLWEFENSPGVAANPPAQWPSDSHIMRATDRPTLVMLVHPRCSCTRASIGELAELMARAHTRPRAYVLFLKPPEFTGGRPPRPEGRGFH